MYNVFVCVFVFVYVFIYISICICECKFMYDARGAALDLVFKCLQVYIDICMHTYICM